MRRFFIFLFIFFASLFFSQCEIGKISFALGDVLMFFINGKVEGKDKKNEIQQINGIKLEAAKKPVNIIQMVDQMIVLKEPRPENIHQFTKELTILEQEKPENIIASIDKIVINADEKPETKIQHIARIELEAKKWEQNFIQNIQEISILAKQRYKNEIGGNESIKLLEKEKPQIEMKKNDAFCFSGVARPQNEIENKDEILIEEKKVEDLQTVTVKALLFSKKEQQKKTNELCKADKFQILCAEKKNQNSICRTEPFEIVTVIPRKFSAQVLSSISNEKFSFLPKVKTNKNNRIIKVEHFKIISEGAVKILEEKKEMEDEKNIELMLKFLDKNEKNGENQNTIERKENFQIKGKESAEVIELKKKVDEMHKALQKYDERCNEVFKVMKGDGMYEISQIENPEEAISKIREIVKKEAKKNMVKEGKITGDDILDTNRIEEIMKADNDFKSEREKTKKKFSGFKENLKNFGEELSKFGTEHKKVIDENKVLRDELAKIKATSNKGVDLKRDVKNGINSQGQKEENGNNELETPSFKKNILEKYKESGIILSQDNTQKKNSRNKNGYSRDKISIHEPNEIKEERQSMWSSISRNLFRSPSYSPCRNNRISFPSFFDGEKFCTDPRQKTTICENICHIPQEKVYFSFFCGNGLNNKVQNVGIDFIECHETSFQIKNGNEAKELNNVKGVGNKKERKIFKKINIFKKGDNSSENNSRIKSHIGEKDLNTSKDVISLNKSTTNVSKRNVNKNDLKKIKDLESKVAGKKLGPRTSFNRSNTSLSNSVMYVEKMEDKNIINNTFEQKKIKKNLGMPRKNEKKDSKRLSYFGGVKGDVPHNLKKQTEIKNDLLKKKKETTKSSLPQKNNAGDMEKVYAKNRALQQQKKTSGAHQENQKVPRQNIINRLKENNAVRKDEKKDLKEEEETKMLRIKTSTNVREKIEKSVIGKNSENRNNNSNSFASLGEKRKSINLNEGRLKGEKNDIKKGDNRENNLQGDKKVPTKTSLLDRFKKKEIKKKE